MLGIRHGILPVAMWLATPTRSSHPSTISAQVGPRPPLPAVKRLGKPCGQPAPERLEMQHPSSPHLAMKFKHNHVLSHRRAIWESCVAKGKCDNIPPCRAHAPRPNAGGCSGTCRIARPPPFRLNNPGERPNVVG